MNRGKITVTISYLIFTFSFLIFSFPLSAQTAGELDTLLGTNAVSVAAAARFVLGAADLLPPDLSGAAAEKAAYDLAFSKGWVNKDAAGTATFKDTAFLIMRAFDFKGGLLYSLFQNPRYAYREMIYNKIIQGRSDPDMEVSGTRLLQILGSALTYSGEDDTVLLNTGGAN
ncbi:MAG: hypothetical protein FWD78_00820 [Treponema sp.]|nr:hypothetical protein [Treponema sp.]